MQLFFGLIFIFIGSLRAESYMPKYAKNFKIIDKGEYKIIFSGEDSYVHRRKISRIIMTSTTFLPSLELLNEEKSLIAFQEKKYISSRKFDQQKIIELPFGFSLEKIISLKPDLVMVGLDSHLDERAKLRLAKWNIPLVINRDFLENSALGRAEWMIFNAAFFNKEREAIILFKKIEEDFIAEKKRASLLASKGHRPLVLQGEMQSGQWVYPGGKSFLTEMITAAGGDVILKNNEEKTSRIDLENFTKINRPVDFWFVYNLWISKKNISEHSFYTQIKFKKLINNTRTLLPSGANGFWEMGLQRPDLLLKDFVHLFYNEGLELQWLKELSQ